MEVMQTVDQIVAILDKFERPIEIALVIVLFMLNRNVKRTSNFSPSTGPADDTSAIKVAKQDIKAQERSKQSRKNQLEKEMKAALDVYFSDKSYEDMTEDEQALYDKAAAYLGGA